MLPWADRLALTRAGWMTEIKLTRHGIMSQPPEMRACGVWARTHYWVGWVAEISLHDHAIVSLDDPQTPARIAALVGSVREACERAARDYPDSVPCAAHGRDDQGRLKIATNTHATSLTETQLRTRFPTEAIPEGLESSALAPDLGHIGRMVDAARDDFHVEDRIDPFVGPPRFSHDCQNRQWAYRLRLAKRQMNGTKISFQPQAASIETLDESLVSGLILACHQDQYARFSRYAPGGRLHGQTSNGLPPGIMTLAEARAEKDAQS